MALYSGDVKSATASNNTAVIEGPTRVKSFYYTANANVGSVVLKDGGSSGTVMVTVAVPANGYGIVPFPGDGIRFNSNVYTTLTNVASVTIFHG
jgi:hypothetical protein